jgi:predicted nucleic acid-binding protein
VTNALRRKLLADRLLGRAPALGHQPTAYDAIHVATAEATGATLLTRDARLARSAGHRRRSS